MPGDAFPAGFAKNPMGMVWKFHQNPHWIIVTGMLLITDGLSADIPAGAAGAKQHQEFGQSAASQDLGNESAHGVDIIDLIYIK